MSDTTPQLSRCYATKGMEDWSLVCQLEPGHLGPHEDRWEGRATRPPFAPQTRTTHWESR
jgi:hypothetical protein